MPSWVKSRLLKFCGRIRIINCDILISVCKKEVKKLFAIPLIP